MAHIFLCCESLEILEESWATCRGLRYIVISDTAAQDVHALSELFRHTALF
ncbi:MAG: hypothetical protein LAN37_10515 [Acidobacteriia bacterium]|nr:hypothetical protein [Terriglobia bacterium]